MANIIYTAGVCNIGPEEIARRRNIGWLGLAASAVVLGVLIWLEANPWWRLLVFLPAFASATGFLQAYFGFCAGFARMGVFNFGALGGTQQVADEASKAKDRRKANQITLYAALIGAVVAVISVAVSGLGY